MNIGQTAKTNMMKMATMITILLMKIIFEARKRSYLVGSVGPTSLLGTQELERQIIFMMSFLSL